VDREEIFEEWLRFEDMSADSVAQLKANEFAEELFREAEVVDYKAFRRWVDNINESDLDFKILFKPCDLFVYAPEGEEGSVANGSHKFNTSANGSANNNRFNNNFQSKTGIPHAQKFLEDDGDSDSALKNV